MNDTIIVASGTSVTDYELGEVIDERFETIVRFNGFEESLQEHEEEVGTSVDEVVTNTNIQVARKLRSKLKHNDFEGLGIDTFYITWTYKRSLRRALKHIKNPLGDGYKICNHESIRRNLNRYAYGHGLDGFDSDPDLSSGLIIIAQKVFEEKVEDLWVHGFDALEMDSVPPKHYYEGDTININRIHDLQNEALIIKQMLEEGKIKKLTNGEWN